MKTVQMQFSETIHYPVEVTIPDGLETHTEPWGAVLIVLRDDQKQGYERDFASVRLSLEVAAKRGLVQVKRTKETKCSHG